MLDAWPVVWSKSKESRRLQIAGAVNGPPNEAADSSPMAACIHPILALDELARLDSVTLGPRQGRFTFPFLPTSMIIMPPRKYVLNLRTGGLSGVVFKAPARKRVSRAKGKALRASVLGRLIHRILNRKKKND